MQVTNIFRNVAFLGQIFEDYPKSNSQIETLAILPSIKNPRWIIPLKNKEVIISALAIYQPSLVRAKLVKRITALAAKAGLSHLAMKNKVYFKKNDDHIKEIFKRDNLHYAIFSGTEGCHRKVTVQVMDDKGKILGYIKVANNEDIDRLLKNETEILGDLSRLNIKNGLFPEVLYYGRINDVDILALDTLKSVNSKFSSSLSNVHLNFLIEIFNKTSSIKRFIGSDFAKGFRKRLRDLEIESLSDWETLGLRKLERIIDFIEDKIGDEKLPFGLCHRDFTPWNTFFHDGELYIFDWEYAEKEYPPLFDVFHFIVQDGILVRHLKPSGLLERVLKHEKLLNKYSSSVGIKKDLLMPLLVCYLLDISLLYVEREKGEVDAEMIHKIEVWTGMTELVIANSS